MEKILLLGDSIRFGLLSKKEIRGYGPIVAEKLAGKAEVFAPDDNCRFAEYTLRYLRDWMKKLHPEEITVIHWNNGLWDALRLDGDEPLTPIPFYAHYLVRIYRALRRFCPDARIIFATSTPVDESRANPNFTRRNEEIRAYNDAAVETLLPLGVEINDLYSVAEEFPPELHADFVHFTEEGSRLLADAVIRALNL